MVYEKCREILLKEHELVQFAVTIQKNIQDAVTAREWTDFEGHFKALEALESEFNALEAEREKLFVEFEASNGRNVSPEHIDAKSRFYAMAAQLPALERNDLTEIYRNLKLEVIKMRMANEALKGYLNGVRTSLQEFFSNVFPERGGKMYTPQGTHFSHDMRSMVLNQRF